MQCDHCQTLLLDHLYGLLDPAEAAGVEKHLAECAGCTAARDQAGRLQGLFARAARSEFPAVRFTAPASEPAVPSSQAALKPAGRRRSWVPWAVAAGVLTMVPGAVIPLGGWSAKYEHARQVAVAAVGRTTEAHIAAAKAEVVANRRRDLIQQQYDDAKRVHDAVLGEWVAAVREAEQADKNRKLAVDVVKPASVQPGAPNHFLVALRDQANTLSGARVEAEVRDQADTVLTRWTIDPKKNAGNGEVLTLPAEVWTKVRPESELFLVVVTVDNKTGARHPLERVRLFGPVYATLLATDKPTYRPGERVMFRSLTLDRVTFRPPAREQSLRYELRKPLVGTSRPVGPDGKPLDIISGTEVNGSTGLVRVGERVEPVLGPDGKPLRGVGCGDFLLSAELPDGDYVLALTEEPGPAGLPPVISFPVTRSIKIRAGGPERFGKKIGFGAASYTAGQFVEAWCELRSQGQPVAGVTAEAVADIDGVPFTLGARPVTGPDGRASFRFQLPATFHRGDARLKITFQTSETRETVVERIPITGRNIVVEFFPEGGSLVVGVPNRVYVRATTPAGQAVELKGDIADGRQTVAHLETLNDPAQPGANRGIGAFTFTPQAGASYSLRPEQPGVAAAVLGLAAASGLNLAPLPDAIALPPAGNAGVVMTVPNPVTERGEPFKVQLHTVGKARHLVVGAYTRGRLSDTKRVTVQPGTMAEVELLAGNDPRGGVTRITVFEDITAETPKADLAPVAERLVFRKPGERLNLAVTTNVPPGRPAAVGSTVEVNISATDEQGRPAAAVLWAAVTNAAVTESPTDRLMPTHFLLAGEVQTPDQLEYADFLLTDHPKAARSLDLVLATQGWRRFAEQKPPRPGLAAKQPAGAPAPGKDADRLLAANGHYPVQRDSSPARESARQLAEANWPRYDEAVKDLKAAEGTRQAALADRSADEAAKTLQASYEEQRRATAELVTAVESASEPLAALGAWRWVAVGCLGVLALVVGAMVALRGVALSLLLTATGSGGLSVFLAVGVPQPEPVVIDDSVPNINDPGSPNLPTKDGSDEKMMGTPGTGKAGTAPGGKKTDTPEKGPRVNPGPSTPLPKPPGTGTIEDVKPPKLVPPPVVKDGRVWWPGPELRRPVPDDLFVGAPKGPSRPRSAPEPKADQQRREDEKAKAEQYARYHAAVAANRIEAAFIERQKAGDLTADRDAFDRVRQAVPRTPPLVVREYAAPRPGTVPGLEEPDTVLWQPVIVLPADGKTTLSLTVGSTAGGYRVMVAGHTADGRIGAARTIVETLPLPPK